MEKISIIVPVFNVARWLPRCLESILSQTFRDFRLYLIDDGSTDGSGEICEEFAHRDSRIRVIHQENRGVSAARNAGLEAAAGAYVTFCDGDDFWAETHLEALLLAAEESGADMVCCNYTCVDEGEHFLHCTAYPASVLTLETAEERVNYILNDVFEGRTGWAVWARLFRAETIRQVRFCECCENFGEDLLFVLEAALHCRVIRAVDDAACFYRRREGSAMDHAREKPMLAARAAGGRWLESRFCAAVDTEQLRRYPLVTLALLKPGLEAVPAADLPGEFKSLPHRDWVEAQMAQVKHSPLARFCVHKNVLRYRLERWLSGPETRV